jgi:hypothetical protein
MKRASRQILTALPLSQPITLFLRVLAQSPWGAVSARVVGGCVYHRAGAALPTVGDPTSHFGGFAGTMWPVSEGDGKGGNTQADQSATILQSPSTPLRGIASASE